MPKVKEQKQSSDLVDLFHTEKRKINDLIPFVGNPRSMTEHQVNSLKKSLKKFGVAELPVIDSDNVIVAGHQRLKALQDMGYGEAEIDVRVASRKLTDKEFQIYNIGSNKITGDFTDELLNFDEDVLLEAGFESSELDELFGVKDFEPEEKDEHVPEVEESICKTGDLWKLGKHTLLCDDCTKSENISRLLNGEKYDMIFTDPPYGLGGYGGRKQMQLIGDDDEDFGRFYKAIPDAKEIYVWGRVFNYVDINFIPIDIIVWKKNNFVLGKGYRGQYEVCFYKGEFSGSDSDVWEVSKDINYVHPTQKPVELCIRAIKNSKPNIILDMFLGSGSTLIACEKTGIICYGCEIDEHYCDVIIKRWEDYTGEKAEKVTE